MTTTEQIRITLMQLTKGLTPKEKHNYLLTLGFQSFKDIEALDADQKLTLLSGLTERLGHTYIVVETKDYIISKPQKPRKVSEISFKVK